MRQAATQGIIWSYDVIGKGKSEPIVILHGWGRSKEEWRKTAEFLNRLRKSPVYLVDLPGFGGTSLPHELSGIKDYARLVREFLRYLGINKYSLIGHSLGGRVGICLASEERSEINELALVDPAGVKSKSVKRLFLRAAAVPGRLVPPRWRRLLIKPWLDEDYQQAGSREALYRAVVKEDLRYLLPKIKVKTLLIWGEKDPILSLTLTKIYRKLTRQVKLRVIWGAGHDPHLTHENELHEVFGEEWK